MASMHYFEFLSSVFDLLPEEDRERLGEMWHGYEQVFAAAYQKMAEAELNTTIHNMQPFTTERWLPYDLTASNKIERAATYSANQDLSVGVNLSVTYLIKFSYDGNPAVEIDLRGPDPTITTIDEIKTKINNTIGFDIVFGIFENTVLQFVSPTVGDSSNITFYPASIPAKDASEFVLGLLPSELPKSYPLYPHVYPIPTDYGRVASIPELRNSIRDEDLETELAEDTDYIIERLTGTLAFKETPGEVLWAKRTLIDLETPYNNYGFLMEIYDTNSLGYLNALRGLWFAFWSGPKPSNVQSALYLLFGLPTADKSGTITELTATTITVTATDSSVLEYDIPDDLEALVEVGDTVTQFQPLVTGIEVFDKVGSPGFIRREVGRAGIQDFLLDEATRGTGDTDETKALQILEEHTFLPQISVESFISPDINLGNVKQFLESIKPLNKAFLFQVIVGKFRETLTLEDRISLAVSFDVTPNMDYHQGSFSDIEDYETVDNPALNTDTDVVGFREEVEIEVNNKFGHVETFVI